MDKLPINPSANRRRTFMPVSGKKTKLSLPSKPSSAKALALGIKLRNSTVDESPAKRQKVEVTSEIAGTAVEVTVTESELPAQDDAVGPRMPSDGEDVAGQQLPPDDVIVGPQLPSDEDEVAGPQLPFEEDNYVEPQLPPKEDKTVGSQLPLEDYSQQDISEPADEVRQSAPDLEDIAKQIGISEKDLRIFDGRHRRRGKPIKIVDYNVDEQYNYNNALIASGAGQTTQPVRSIGSGKHQLRGLISSATDQRESLEESFASGKRNKRESGAKYGF
ncbi:mitotic checkpoint regulator, MAD2B-interacting-domain-containing protein [Lipomyces arxii]|uniref:mitotic checkpoint regulator, MAD2B-interacting-domain-containing protein n=1 Tax=Lipomyces arxii TaxID=56418 RepID=UPI0034CD8CB6